MRPKLAKELEIENTLAVPKIEKIVVNVGAGEAALNSSVLEKIISDLSAITGQKPVVTKAKKSISAFKIRRGVAIGVKVTLRGKRMWDFLEKLIKIVLPRIRNFRGVSKKSFDGHGNLNLGLSEQTLFSEIDYDKIDKIRGLGVTIVTNVTNADDDEAAQRLLESLGMPFKEVK